MRKSLTIAAGFECRDGLAFATDLEITDGIVKRSGAKSTPLRRGNKAPILAGAGYYDVLAYACEQTDRAEELRGTVPR
jgi:hypothetical protein